MDMDRNTDKKYKVAEAIITILDTINFLNKNNLKSLTMKNR